MVRLGTLIRRVMFTAVNVTVSILFQKFGAREVGASLGFERYFLTCHFWRESMDMCELNVGQRHV
jgi:hypothetical protein